MSNPNPMNIRKGSDDDLDVLSGLSRKLSLELKMTEPFELDQIKQNIMEKIHSDGHAYLFEIDKKIVGYTLVSQNNDPLSIEEFFIIPEERGKNYGNVAVALLSEVTKWTAVRADAPVWHAMAGGM
ncbi:MAG: GNAT family N-acetyltransferase [Methanomassiliicoccales archaeon]